MLRRNKECKIFYNPSQWKSVSPEALDLIHKLLEVDPKKRIHAKDALLHPWFTTEKHGALLSVIDKIKRYNNEKRFDVSSIKPNFDSGIFTINTPLLCLKHLKSQNTLGSMILPERIPALHKSSRVGSPKTELRDLKKMTDQSQDQSGKANFPYIRKFTTPANSFKPGKFNERFLPDMDICGSNGRFSIEPDKMNQSSKNEETKAFAEKVVNPQDEYKIAFVLYRTEVPLKIEAKPLLIKQPSIDLIGNSLTIRCMITQGHTKLP